MKVRGFSLLELLVAVAIFAVVAALAWGGLDTLARARVGIDAEAAKLAELQTAIGRFERDLRQAVPRPASNAFGAREAALQGEFDALAVSVWLPSGGWQSTGPELQRIHWSCAQRRWQRQRFVAVDQGPGASPDTQELLRGIESCRLRYYTRQGAPVDRWPPRNASAEELPRAVELVLRVGDGEEFRRLIELPAAAELVP